MNREQLFEDVRRVRALIVQARQNNAERADALNRLANLQKYFAGWDEKLPEPHSACGVPTIVTEEASKYTFPSR